MPLLLIDCDMFVIESSDLLTDQSVTCSEVLRQLFDYIVKEVTQSIVDVL